MRKNQHSLSEFKNALKTYLVKWRYWLTPLFIAVIFLIMFILYLLKFHYYPFIYSLF